MDEDEQMRILVVEDDDELRATMSGLLRWQGYAVNEAAHGAEALSVAVTARPDLIVTDLDMPVMDGATFIRCCRGISGLDTVPIVVMSAQAESEASLQRLEPAPVRAYLAKPFGVEELTEAIEGDTGAG